MAQVLQLCKNGIQPITLCKKGISKLLIENDYQSQQGGGGAKKQVKSMLI